MVVILLICLNASSLLADSKKQKAPKNLSSRFTLIKGEAFDKATKLTWRRCSAGCDWKEGVGCIGSPELMSLDEAIKFARQAGDGWRVPTIMELSSIIEQGGETPAINSIVFPDIMDLGDGAPFWSVTPFEEMPMLIYFVDFLSGRADGHSRGFKLAVRLVRN